MNSPLVHFLHTEDIESIPLITFLVSFQNEFLDQCAASSTEKMELLHEVVSAVKEEHVITYDKDDLYTLIYRHCDHSYEMGGRSEIQYNMNGAEKDLINSILYDSRKIDMTNRDLTFSYVDDVRHSQLFSLLHKKIQQVGYHLIISTSCLLYEPRYPRCLTIPAQPHYTRAASLYPRCLTRPALPH